MVPGTWLSAIFFAFLVIPGLLFDLLATRRRVGAPESAFREIGRIVLASLVFSGLAFAVLAVFRAVLPAWMADPGRLLSTEKLYLSVHYRLILRTLLLEVLLATTFVILAHLWLARGQSPLRTASAWQMALREDCPAGRTPHVRVRMTDGTVYVGTVQHYTADLDLSDRELVLAPPLFSKTSGKPLASMPVEWQRLVIKGDEVHSMAVSYRPRASRSAKQDEGNGAASTDVQGQPSDKPE